MFLRSPTSYRYKFLLDIFKWKLSKILLLNSNEKQAEVWTSMVFQQAWCVLMRIASFQFIEVKRGSCGFPPLPSWLLPLRRNRALLCSHLETSDPQGCRDCPPFLFTPKHAIPQHLPRLRGHWKHVFSHEVTENMSHWKKSSSSYLTSPAASKQALNVQAERPALSSRLVWLLSAFPPAFSVQRPHFAPSVTHAQQALLVIVRICFSFFAAHPD